jgi:outer membrane protein TolC
MRLRSNFQLPFAFAAAVLFPFVALAEAVRLTPEYIARLADGVRAYHPALRASGARAAALREEAAAVRVWPDPEASFGVLRAGEKGPDLEMEGDLAYGVEQRLPLAGVERQERRVARRMAEAAGLQADLDFQTLRFELARALLAAALNDERVALLEEERGWVERMAAVARERLGAGREMQGEAAMLESEVARMEAEATAAVARGEGYRATLNRLLDRPQGASWPPFRLPAIADPVRASFELEKLAVENEARLAVLRKEVEVAEGEVGVARRRGWPEVKVGVAGRQSSTDGGWREGEAMVGVSLPLFNIPQIGAAVRASRARLEAARAETEAYEAEVRGEVRELVSEIGAARAMAAGYVERVIPRAEEAFRSAEAAWSAGGGSLRAALDAARAWSSARREAAGAVEEQWRTLAELSLCCGIADLRALQMLKQTIPSGE